MLKEVIILPIWASLVNSHELRHKLKGMRLKKGKLQTKTRPSIADKKETNFVYKKYMVYRSGMKSYECTQRYERKNTFLLWQKFDSKHENISSQEKKLPIPNSIPGVTLRSFLRVCG